MMSRREFWESAGKTNPYYTVATFDKFLSANLDETAREEFFKLGRDYVDTLWHDLETLSGAPVCPRMALDFGCGVGRVLLSLADRCDTVVGVDISENMIAEASRNCESRGVHNVRLLQSEQFAADRETFDLIHSVVVFQHIDPRHGMSMIENLLVRLNPDGVGMLHVTYFDRSSLWQRVKGSIYGRLGKLRAIADNISGRPKGPWMPMHLYDLNAIFARLQLGGCHKVSVYFSDHGLLGAMIFFQKSGSQKY